MNVGQAVTIATPIVVAFLALIGTMWGKSLSRKTDAATARRTETEATRNEVDTARGLVEEISKLYKEQRTLNTEQRVDYEKRLTAAVTQLGSLSDEVKVFSARQATLLAMLAAHAPWDFAAYSALKQGYPDYPPPPPLDHELSEYPRVDLVHRDRHPRPPVRDEETHSD